MSTELIINASLPETRIAMMENGEIQDLLIERASGKGVTGNIYKGRVTRVLPGMQAAFVDIGLEKAAFLYVDDVFVHSEIWEAEEGTNTPEDVLSEINQQEASSEESNTEAAPTTPSTEAPTTETRNESESTPEDESVTEEDENEENNNDPFSPPVSMGPPPADYDEDDNIGNRIGNTPANSQPADTLAPQQTSPQSSDQDSYKEVPDGQPAQISENYSAPLDSAPPSGDAASDASPGNEIKSGSYSHRGNRDRGGRGGRYNNRRGNRGGRFRNRNSRDGGGRGGRYNNYNNTQASTPEGYNNYQENLPGNYQEQIHDEGSLDSDRSMLDQSSQNELSSSPSNEGINSDRPETSHTGETQGNSGGGNTSGYERPHYNNNRREFRSQRSRDRRIRPKQTRSIRNQVNIQDLLTEGQEVLVQVAKEPIATKGARLTCHISLPGRHLVCMPTIDHVGVSRRIERDDDRRRLRDFVERHRPRNLGFIVRTASGKQSDKRVKQDIEYLTNLWNEIREKAASVTAPAMVYEDLNPVLRTIRDWVTEDIDKIIVDSRYHYNEIQRFASHFMPSLKQKVELYHGDIPIFDAYNISTELSRALERKVWLKSGGYIVIDQAEALVAIDVNTGRYVGKKNLEDTILKTNLEAVQEIAYQLRLRNAGGIIIIDFIDMEKEDSRQRVYRALDDALKMDRARPTIMKISDLGLVEMTRKRTRDTMVRSLCEPCSACEGKGFVKSKQTVAYEILREVERAGVEKDIHKILVQAHPDVIDILAIDERETLDHIERRYRKQIYLQAVPNSHQEQFEVVSDKKAGAAMERSNSHDRDRERNRERYRNRDRDRNKESGDQRQYNPNYNAVTPPSSSSHEESSANADATSAEGTSTDDTQTPTSAPDTSQQSSPSENTAGSLEGPSTSEINPETSCEPAAYPASFSDNSDFDNEEDRLAFLRAQAAQDAALARLTNTGNTTTLSGRPNNTRNNANRNNRGSGRRDNNRNNNRRGGGRFRNRNNWGRRDSYPAASGASGGGDYTAPSAVSAAPLSVSPSTSDTPSGSGNDSSSSGSGEGGTSL